MTTFDALPVGTYLPAAPSSAMLIGPHNQFVWRGLSLNVRGVLECYWIDDFSGFDTPDLRVSAQESAQEEGENPDPGFHGGRTMTLTGWIQAGTYTTMLNMSRALVDTMIDLFESDLLIKVDPAAVAFTQPSVTIGCRPTDFNLSKQIQGSDITGVFKRAFTIALRAGNPVYKGLVQHTAHIIPTVTDTRGRFYDRVYPLEYSSLMDSSGHHSSGDNSVVVHNAGNWRSKPIATFAGPLGGVRLTNVLNGQKIILRDNILGGNTVRIDVRAGDITNQAGTDVAGTFDSRSDWMWFEANRTPNNGDNELVLSVESFGTGGRVDFSWYDTWI